MDTAIGETPSSGDPDRPLPRIRDLVERMRAVERELSIEVRRARNEGYSWQAIAPALGVSRQAAHKKYGRGT